MIENFKQRIIDWHGLVDPTLSEIENLLLQFNHSNNSAFTLDQIEFGTPVALNSVDPTNPGYNIIPLKQNTSVIVTAKPGIKIRFVEPFRYRRVSVEFQWKLLGGEDTIIVPREVNTVTKLEKYVKEIMPYIPGSIIISLDNKRLTLRAKENSYIYYDSIDITVTHPPGIMDPIIEKTELPNHAFYGFHYTRKTDIKNSDSFIY